MNKKLSECRKCSWSNIRSHISSARGTRTASTMVIFNREPISEKDIVNLEEFIRQIKYYVSYDIYYTYAVKCFTKEKLYNDPVINCREWVKREIDVIKPHLLVLMGNAAKLSVLGKYAKYVVDNIFYENNGKVIFTGSNIYGSNILVKESLHKLLMYIREFYVKEVA